MAFMINMNYLMLSKKARQCFFSILMRKENSKPRAGITHEKLG